MAKCTMNSRSCIAYNDLCDVQIKLVLRGRRDRDCMVVGFTTTCAISPYHH